MTTLALNPDCAAGKCGGCSGTAWSDDTDALIDCEHACHTPQTAALDGLPPRPSGAAPRKRRPKDIGTAAETAVVRYLQANGWPGAERRALRGAYDCGDVTGCPGIVWEVKGGKAAKTAGDGQVYEWLRETEAERFNARADVGVLILQRAGAGPLSVGRWWAIAPLAPWNRAVYGPHAGRGARYQPDFPLRFHLADAATILRGAGYGDPLTGARLEGSR